MARDFGPSFLVASVRDLLARRRFVDVYTHFTLRTSVSERYRILRQSPKTGRIPFGSASAGVADSARTGWLQLEALGK